MQYRTFGYHGSKEITKPRLTDSNIKENVKKNLAQFAKQCNFVWCGNINKAI